MSAEGWDKKRVVALLDSNPRAVERAMVVLYKAQTLEERLSAQTTKRNGVGFSAFHAELGTEFARRVLGGRRLEGYDLARARKMAKRYTRQLLAAIEKKQGRERQ